MNIARVELVVPDPALAAQVRVPAGEQLQPWSEVTAAARHQSEVQRPRGGLAVLAQVERPELGERVHAAGISSHSPSISQLDA